MPATVTPPGAADDRTASPRSLAMSRREPPRLAEVPFGAEHKLMATFHEMDDDAERRVVRYLVKGAPDVLLAQSTRHLGEDVSTAPPAGDATTKVLADNGRRAGEGLAARGLTFLATMVDGR